MTREFEVLYVIQDGPQRTAGPTLKTMEVKAAHEKAAREVVEGAGVTVKAIRELRVVIDPNQNYFRVEEAAEYLRIGASTFYETYLETGILPKAMEGKPVYSRRQLDAVALRGMKKMDPTILKEAA